MKQTNSSFTGVCFGCALVFGSWFRYFVLYPDLDKAFFFGLIGLMIIIISWNYAGRIQLSKEIKSVKETLNSVEEWLIDEVNKK